MPLHRVTLMTKTLSVSQIDDDDDEDEEEQEDNIAIFGTETDDEQSSDEDKCDKEMFWEQSNNLTEK